MRPLLPLLVVLAFARCATLDHGPMQRIHVDSDPFPATVKTSRCGPGSTKETQTAGVVWVSRRAKRCTLTFSAPGFEPQSVTLRRGISDKVRENAQRMDDFCDGGLDCRNLSDLVAALFLGGMFAGTGFGVDAATGAMYQQEPSTVWVELAEAPPPP